MTEQVFHRGVAIMSFRGKQKKKPNSRKKKSLDAVLAGLAADIAVVVAGIAAERKATQAAARRRSRARLKEHAHAA